MGKKYIENDTAHTMYVGGCAIAPGEGREVFVPDAPPAEAATEEPAEPDTDGPLHELLAGNVAAVAAGLEGLSADSLMRLRELEAAGLKPRKGVLEALDAASIAAADAALNLKSDPL
jgi:hypothetical protein